MPKVTFLVNSYDKPTNLWCILGSLIQQTDPDWEAVVLLNHSNVVFRREHRDVLRAIDDRRISAQDSHHDRHSMGLLLGL